MEDVSLDREISKWSWGGFVFGWFWGIFNGTWISFLTLIPYAGIAMCIILGLRGRRWAWRNKGWNDLEHFKSTQRKWDIAGIVGLVAGVIIAILYVALTGAQVGNY